MKISSSLEDYIEAISEIIEEKGHAHTKDIATKLNIKMPSATNALQTLRDLGLIEYQSHIPVTLTAKGTELGATIRRRHYSLKTFFTNILKIDDAHADEVACKFEHIIGEKISSRLAFLADAIMENPDCKTLRDKINTTMATISIDNDSVPVPLAELADNESCVIFKVNEDLQNMSEFAELGLVEGTLIKMEGKVPFGNLITIKVMGSSLPIRIQDAKNILVKRTYDI